LNCSHWRSSYQLVGSTFKLIITSLFLSQSPSTFGQLIDNKTGVALLDEAPYFSPKFIKAAKIKSIQGDFSYKKQSDVIRNSKYVTVYEFDTLGRLVLHYSTAKGDVKSDTTVYTYAYNQAGLLISKRISEKKGFLATDYYYNEEQQLIKEETWREIDTLHSKIRPVIERRLPWNTETMTYAETTGERTKKIFSSDGINYLEKKTVTDSLGYKTREELRYTFSSNKLTTYYRYDELKRIVIIEQFRNLDSIPANEQRFQYDQYGNLIAKASFRNGQQFLDEQVIYSSETGLLYSFIKREIPSNFITITRFNKFTFWDK